jgi:hypothetical protein
MNIPPTIKGKELRPLNNSIWNKIRSMASDEKNRGESWSHILICGFYVLSSSDAQVASKAFRDEDLFFQLASQSAIELTEDEEKEITEYLQGVVNRWEAAQIETGGEGKKLTQATHPTTEIS